MRVVRAFGQEPRHVERFSELNEENRQANMKTVYLNAAYFPAIELMSALATVGILLYGGYQAIDGDVTVGVLVAFVAALNNFFDPIQQLSQLYTTYQAGMAALDKIFELLDESPDLVDKPDAVELPRAARRDRASRTCPSATARATTPCGPCATSISPSRRDRPSRSSARPAPGSRRSPSSWRGSTTRPRAGCSWTAWTCATRGPSRCARQLGVVPQEGFLFSGSIRDNIAFGRPEATDEEVAAAAAAVGADDFIEALPEGYDSEVGERGSHLSAGQRQLVAFARALIADPRILVLDEATSNVDIHTESRIEEGLRRLLAGRTAIVIAHRLSTIRRAGQIAVLEHGQVVERGTHEELLEKRGAYRRLHEDWASHAAA